MDKRVEINGTSLADISTISAGAATDFHYYREDESADLQAWAADALTQHRIFHDTFLFGCSAHEGIALAALGGVDEVREEIGAFVGVVVGAELRRLRAVGPAITAVDWAAHDAHGWQPPAAGGADA